MTDPDDPWAKIARLKARLAEVEAERDELKNDCHIAAGNSEHWQQRTRNLEAEVAALADALKAHTDLLDEARRERGDYRSRLKATNDAVRRRCIVTCEVEAERDRMRPVVEAAEAWRDGKFGHVTPVAAPYYCGAPEEPPLVAAVDAYRAGQNTPETAPASTLPREDGEVEGPATDTAQAERGVQGDRPYVRTDPAQRFGEPHVGGVDVRSIGGSVWMGEDAADEYGITREQVLVACWWLGRHGTKKWRKRFGDWSKQAETELWHSRYTIPNPPDDLGDEPAQPEVTVTMSVLGDDRVYTPEEFTAMLDAIPPAPLIDPPGLDAAIEAGREAGHRRLAEGWPPLRSELATRPLDDVIDAAVRAAAPVLRAGALREAADELRMLRADLGTRSTRFRDGLTEAIDVIGARADRIGGAT